MGNSYTINYDKIYTIDEVLELLKTTNKKDFWSYDNTFATTLLYDLNVRNPTFLKIFVCNDFCEENADDEEHRKEIAEDYILSHGKHQYYVAEICLETTGSFPAIANMLWNKLDDVFSLSCHIVKYHKKYPNYKKYCILNYVTPNRNKRYVSSGDYKGIAYDLYEILNVLRQTTYDKIDKHICDWYDKKNTFEDIKQRCENNNIEIPYDVDYFLQKFSKKEKLLREENRLIYDFYENNNS